jgi:hypothetical protein
MMKIIVLIYNEDRELKVTKLEVYENNNIAEVSSASVTIEKISRSRHSKGLLVLVGIEDADTQADVDWLVGKLSI